MSNSAHGDDRTNKVIKRFGLSNLAVDNRTSVLLLTFLILVTGIMAYQAMPKENFPEIEQPIVYVGVPYPGNSPVEMENLITRHIEKEIGTIEGLSKIQSTCIQDYTVTTAEFDFDVPVQEAVTDVKDAYDRAKGEFPSDFDQEASIFELNFSDMPVININLSGADFSLDELKEYAEFLEDEIEDLSEISKVELRGSKEKEVEVRIDKNKMESLGISFFQIEEAIQYENRTISAGDILTDDFRRTIRIEGEFETVDEIGDIIVKNAFQQVVFLRDIAEVHFDYKEISSYARIDGKDVISLDVMKRSGENLIRAVEKIMLIVEEAKQNELPRNLSVDITNDTSRVTKLQVSNLENSIISGVILVVLVLLFFLGLRNALFVGVAIPLSMLMGFLILSIMGITMNMVVLFSLVLALGMLVDNGIVVVENIYRLMQEGYSPVEAAKEGVGEVAMPIIVSTATTLAAFFPMLFWEGIMGEFMKFLPLTLIIVLLSSLFVALVINPVLTSLFMKLQNGRKTVRHRRIWTIIGSTVVLAAVFNVVAALADQPMLRFLGNIFLLVGVLTLLNVYVLQPLADRFQNRFLPRLESFYERTLRWMLHGVRPYALLGLMFVMFIGAIMFFASSRPDVVLFPDAEPNYVNIFIELPTGTDIEKTNRITRRIEGDVIDFVGQDRYAHVVEAVLTNVGEGTSDPNTGDQSGNMGSTPNKAKITVSFVEYEKREGVSTVTIWDSLKVIASGYPGVQITTGKDPTGPPTGPPISIAIRGEDFPTLIRIQDEVRARIEGSDIRGIEELKTDLDASKPELIIDIDREAARRYGASTSQISGVLRTALFGKEVGKFKEGDDDYEINLRQENEARYDLDDLLNQLVTFRDQADGELKQVPISAVADVRYSTTFGNVKRTDQDRQITLYSNVDEGYNANEIIAEIDELLTDYYAQLPQGYSIGFTGEQEEQAESMQFLLTALIIAVFVIFLIIVAQFNSVTAPIIIMISVLLSTIGVFTGLTVFRMDFVVIMTMIGIISLAGVVVNNAIVLIDYTNLVRGRMRNQLGVGPKGRLPAQEIRDSIVEGGKTRLRPVLLTAITTVLGLLPLALGLNINFFTLIRDFDPQFFMGGDNQATWAPMALTVIFGLTFATFLTLVVVPVMILLFDKLTHWVYTRFSSDGEVAAEGA